MKTRGKYIETRIASYAELPSYTNKAPDVKKMDLGDQKQISPCQMTPSDGHEIIMVKYVNKSKHADWIKLSSVVQPCCL